MAEETENRWEYEERENVTYEIVRIGRTHPSYTDTKIVYRFWPVGDGDWKLQIIDSDNAPVEPILIPAKVIQKMLNSMISKPPRYAPMNFLTILSDSSKSISIIFFGLLCSLPNFGLMTSVPSD